MKFLWTYRSSLPLFIAGGALLLISLLSVDKHKLYQYVGVTDGSSVILEEEEDVEVAYDEFGIDVSSYDTIDRHIKRNETIAEILTAHNVPFTRVAELVDVARPVFDVRGLQAGRPLRIYRDDSLQTAQYVVYERDPINYVVFNLQDSLSVFEGRREVTIEQRRASGVITSSLYAAMDAQGVDPDLAIKLSEVYAWQIDFYRIQKEDAFDVVYEQQLVDGTPVGVGNIIAARFRHYGQDFMGFRFEQDGGDDYFDEEGNSLRKAFLKAPLKFKRISSRYTKRRFHPVQKRYKPHLGTDYAADPGTPVLAIGDGVVVEAAYTKYNGNYVKIRHNGTYTTGYLHLSSRNVRSGQRVKQGDMIGRVGSTGLATGPHLCYRFWKNGQQVDPHKEEIPSANPVDPEYRDAFFAVRDSLMKQLLDLPEVDQRLASERSRDRATL